MIRLHALNGGRVRVWLLMHGQDAKHAAALVAIVMCYLVASHFDYQDQINEERRAREAVTIPLRQERDAATEQLRQERTAREFPRTTFVIEARTVEEASLKLAEIAGDSDVARAKLKGRK